MNKSDDIVTFPELFAGMEQFLDEQIAHLKRAGLLTASLALPCGFGVFWLLGKLA